MNGIANISITLYPLSQQHVKTEVGGASGVDNAGALFDDNGKDGEGNNSLIMTR